jgi:hypothetical protein
MFRVRRNIHTRQTQGSYCRRLSARLLALLCLANALGGLWQLWPGTTSASARLNNYADNTPPTISVVNQMVRRGSPVQNVVLATASDPDQPANTLSVVWLIGSPAFAVTVSNVANNNGTVTADLVANCVARAAFVILQVTDNQGVTVTATVNITVTDNTPPTVGNYANTSVLLGGSVTVTPSAAPADNGSVANITATASGTFSGTFSANLATGAVTVNNAGPPGNHTVTVTLTDNCGATTQQSFTLTVNAPPTINAVANSRQQGSAVSNSIIATVNDVDGDPLNVALSSGTVTLTSNGVTVSNLVNTNGTVTADITTDCAATSASFSLVVSDNRDGMASAILTVSITPNTAPTLTYADQSARVGGSLTVTPTLAMDNGTVAFALHSLGSYTGSLSVNSQTGVVTLSNIKPTGSSVITLRATDNCGETTYASFTLTASVCAAALSKPRALFAANGGSGSFSITIDSVCSWTAISNHPDWLMVTAPAGAYIGAGTISFSVASNPNHTRRAGSLSVAGQTFQVLQGAPFNDVPPSHAFYTEIGKLSAAGLTLGCGNGNYCPDIAVTREQLAAFIIRALHAPDYVPPTPLWPRFADVSPSSSFYAFVEEMAVRQITLGCGGGNYCPTSVVTREQMAALLSRALGVFNPPPAIQRFADVPPANPFYAFIEEIAQRQITLGCGGGNYCPASVVTRAQMAAFLVRAFGL